MTRQVGAVLWLASTMLAQNSASAANVADQLPPPFLAIDANGVDRTDGSFTFRRVDLTIGPAPGEGGLIHGEAIRGAERRPLLVAGLTIDDATNLAYVSAGEISDVFQKVGPNFVSVLGRGSQLVGPNADQSYTYTAEDGTVAVLAQLKPPVTPPPGFIPAPPPLEHHHPAQWRPDGVSLEGGTIPGRRRGQALYS